MKLKTKFCLLLVVTIVTIIKVSSGVRIQPGRWKYCHDKNRLDAPGHDPCENQWTGICQTGINQSPINIVKKEATKTKTITEPFAFSTNRQAFPVLTIKNNGHTVQASPDHNLTDHYTMSGVIYMKIFLTSV